MKKILLPVLAIAMMAMIIGSAYAAGIPTPDFCQPYCSPGFTPGFWKHNIEVRLDLTNGKYSAFVGPPSDGVKLTDAIMNGLLEDIQNNYGSWITFEILLEALQGPGWSVDRTNAANLLNEAAGYGPY